jgi:hypothetical protein
MVVGLLILIVAVLLLGREASLEILAILFKLALLCIGVVFLIGIFIAASQGV